VSDLSETWPPYRTLELARAKVRALLRHERVVRVAVVRNVVPPSFVEWLDR
jgi:hypothetical protein